MKKTIAALLAVLILTGCSAREPAPVAAEPEPEPAPAAQTETVETPPQTVELPVEAATPASADYETKLLEGLVGDAVGYSLAYPVFSGFDAAETVNGFYTSLVSQLEGYVQTTVNEQCLERNCVASAYGEILSVQVDEELEVHYRLRVEYSDVDKEQCNERTDYFDLKTGEVRSETK